MLFNHHQQNINSANTSLIFIADNDNQTDNSSSFYNSTYLINLFGKKLKDLCYFVSKIFLINRADSNDIQLQIKSILTGKSLEKKNILVISTSNSNDLIIESLFEIYAANANKSYNFKCLSNADKNESSLRLLLIKHSNKNSIESSLLFIKHQNHQFRYNSAILFDYLLLKQTSQTTTTTMSVLFVDNCVNADFYVYELAQLDRFLNDKLQSRFISSSNISDHLLPTEDRPDLAYLRSKFDLNAFYEKLNDSVSVIEQAFDRYNSAQICVSFNGGKDCCVVLYLFYAVALKVGVKFPLNVLHIRIQDDFEEMNEFISKTIKSFYKDSLEFIVIEETNQRGSLKECLVELKKIRSNLSSILMGTRRSDGAYFKQMNAYEPTDGDWPRFMRINPILDWTFSEIWYFIRLLRLPYCSLYDLGYTSLDSKMNTIPNPALKKQQEEESANYMPAYMLANEDEERKSRKQKLKSSLPSLSTSTLQ